MPGKPAQRHEMANDLSSVPFVAWFRSVAPYVNLFRGKTFLVAFGGKAIAGPLARTLAYDVNLLAALGVRLVLVHGARPQIEALLRERGLQSVYHGNYRVTDAKAIHCVIDAVGSIYVEIEALLSQGLADTPMANSTIRVVGGNFITAKPVGVVDGVDLQYSGQVRKIDAEGIRAQLTLGNIVLLSCIGSSPTGEIFNLAMEEVAEAVATSLLADKLIFLTDSRGATDIDGALLDELTVEAAERLISLGDWLSTDLKRYLPCAVRASRAGVGRVHLIGWHQFVNQTDRQRLVSRNESSGEDELLGLARTNQAGKTLGAPRARDDAQEDLRLPKGRVIGCNAYVGTQG